MRPAKKRKGDPTQALAVLADGTSRLWDLEMEALERQKRGKCS